jgi:hypothetical protein
MICKEQYVYALNNVAIKYNLKISVNKMKMMALKGKVNVRSKIVLNNHIIEQVNSFNYLGYTIAVTNNKDLEIKLNRFHQMCGTIRRMLYKKTRKDTQIKFYKAMAGPTFTYGSEIWTLTIKQEARIETVEMNFLRSVAGYERTDQIRN